MTCQKCGSREATVHYQAQQNGDAQALRLCATCAAQMGITNFYGFADSPFSSFFSGGRTCPTCGLHEQTLRQDGRVGCADCYTQFADILQPYIKRVQGAVQHVGVTQQEDATDTLKNKLAQAIAQENYEEAARLRDEIRRLEGA